MVAENCGIHGKKSDKEGFDMTALYYIEFSCPYCRIKGHTYCSGKQPYLLKCNCTNKAWLFVNRKGESWETSPGDVAELATEWR